MSPEPPPGGQSTPVPTDAADAYGDHPEPFRPERRPPLQRAVAVAAALSRYRAAGVRRDLPAGTGPVIGLYALLLPTVGYALLGSSRQLMVGPDGATSVLVATALAPMAVSDPGEYAALAAMLALMVGGVFVVARLARLGWMADYLSHPVLVGYIHGIALVLIVGQLEKLLGVDVEATASWSNCPTPPATSRPRTPRRSPSASSRSRPWSPCAWSRGASPPP